ncbi:MULTISPECIES: acetoin utilization AcuB family protein [Planococcus]|uniref:Acetoin utilization protein AcuB n=1 Tax=Planococcus rifietoensis TaxID=200991 RepID=A0A0U2YNV8_9BACL|nr:MULTISPECIES: acetoin utilization AcuB family protein [Planococcus]ALS74413.1 acetoin utilization protein AcuB [Planococcus rifietoensis]AUD13579.1 acetoin utilization protein AcuB [Planococcus sp. MB-3u-03]MDE0584848.1 acetoin utilization AcuB family protein [Planococcus sp. A6]PKG46464.1 acetoin utilization protein AcuB [Planococcus sp. Urea-trap-24]PKG89400.1 acetoin utilization protein AcuB [Planococcus sp. Urea-3u-39]
MLVEEIMKKDVFTLRSDQTVQDVLDLFEEKRIRHAPIVDDGKVVGIVTDRDLKDAMPSMFTVSPKGEPYKKKVSEIMTKNPMIAHPLDFVEEIALLFYEQKIGCLPVVSQNELVGFLTETDLLYTYIELTGAHQPGSQIEIKVPNRSGALYEVSKVFYEHKVNVLSVLVYPDREDNSNKILAFRIKTMNPISIIEDLRKEGFDVLWPNLMQE